MHENEVKSCECICTLMYFECDSRQSRQRHSNPFELTSVELFSLLKSGIIFALSSFSLKRKAYAIEKALGFRITIICHVFVRTTFRSTNSKY